VQRVGALGDACRQLFHCAAEGIEVALAGGGGLDLIHAAGQAADLPTCLFRGVPSGVLPDIAICDYAELLAHFDRVYDMQCEG